MITENTVTLIEYNARDTHFLNVHIFSMNNSGWELYRISDNGMVWTLIWRRQHDQMA